jgi:hypothetical protein
MVKENKELKINPRIFTSGLMHYLKKKKKSGLVEGSRVEYLPGKSEAVSTYE